MCCSICLYRTKWNNNWWAIDCTLGCLHPRPNICDSISFYRTKWNNKWWPIGREFGFWIRLPTICCSISFYRTKWNKKWLVISILAPSAHKLFHFVLQNKMEQQMIGNWSKIRILAPSAHKCCSISFYRTKWNIKCWATKIWILVITVCPSFVDPFRVTERNGTTHGGQLVENLDCGTVCPPFVVPFRFT